VDNNIDQKTKPIPKLKISASRRMRHKAMNRSKKWLLILAILFAVSGTVYGLIIMGPAVESL